MKHIYYILIIVFWGMITTSCSKKSETTEINSNLVEITTEQFKTENMQLGDVESKVFETVVKCNGMIAPKHDGIINISAPVSGIIKDIKCHEGHSVGMNQTLIEIGGNDVIDIQRDFAEASAKYKKQKNEYDRVKSLFDEKVATEKDFIIAESDYKSALAMYNSLKLKLEKIGLSTAKIENGEFYTSYFLKSPVSGIISNLNAYIGNHIDEESVIAKITNPNKYIVIISVFPADINQVKVGQEVRFKPSNAQNFGSATINSVGIAMNEDTKAIECFANIKDKNNNYLIENESVTVEILTKSDTVNALPTEAIIKTEAGNYILALEKQEKDKYIFRKVNVTSGREFQNFTEIPDKISIPQVLTKGVYNIIL